MSPEEMAQRMEMADFEKMNQIRSRVEDLVEDEATGEALKPWYRQFCERPCFHDDYLPSFNRPNTHLVDTDGKGVQQITEKGVVVDSTEYELDCLIFATGFEVGTPNTRRAGYDVVGKSGQTLSDKWNDGLPTLYGFQANGFPNCFFMGVTQGGFTANFPHMLNEQSLHIAYMVNEFMSSNANCVEASLEGENAWVDTIAQMAVFNASFLESCTPGYYNNEGMPGGGTRCWAASMEAAPKRFSGSF